MKIQMKELKKQRTQRTRQEEENMYTAEEKAKLANIMAMFDGKGGGKELRAKAQNEKMKLISDEMIGNEKKALSGAAYEFKKHKKFVVFDRNSCFCLQKGNLIRDKAVWLICLPIFDNFIVLTIFINSIFMACYEYDDRENIGATNIFIEQAGHVFTITFMIECFLKIIAMGFIHHKNSYLRDSWNWLDFAVVCVGITDYIPGITGSNLKALRTLRVLRPLRSINKFPSMKKLISSLLASLPALGNAVMFMMFIFLLFCILGVQSFSGILYQRCRYDPQPNIDPVSGKWTTWPKVEDPNDPGLYQRLCSKDGSGVYSCPSEYTCGSPGEFKLSLESDGVPDSELIMYGIITFDNIIAGMITIFQVITLEGWSILMYNIGDASPQWMAETYCLMLVLIGSFFLLNVILAVIMDTFDEVASQEEEKLKKQKADLRELKKEYGFEVSESEIERNSSDSSIMSSDISDSRNMSQTQDNNGSQKSENPDHIKQMVPARALKNPVFKIMYKVCTDNSFNIFITSCIVLNTMLLAMDKYPIRPTEEHFQHTMNTILSWIFFGEMIIKLLGLGLKDYASDSFNLFDCAVVMISLIENIIVWAGIDFGGGGAISALRAIRLLRVFKLARSWTSFRELLQKIIITLKDITNISVLLLIFMFIFSLVGSEMYAYKIMYNNTDMEYVIKDKKQFNEQNGVFPRQNFNTLYNGLTTIFIVFIGEDWNSVMYDHYRATGPLTILYFMFLFIFGNLILLNLFLAILLKNFEEPPGKEEQEEEQTIQKASFLKRLKNTCTSCCFKYKLQTVNDDQNDYGKESESESGAGSNQNEKEVAAVVRERDADLEMFNMKKEKSDDDEVEDEYDDEEDEEDEEEEEIVQKVDENQDRKYKKTEFSISMIKLSEVKKSQGPKFKEIKLTGNSIMIMKEDNEFRLYCSKIVGHSNFDNLVIMLILISTILLAIENPYEYPLSQKKKIMEILDMILSFVFLFELLIKVVVYGFAFNGEDSYLKNSWNKMDFIIVFFSMVSIVFKDIDLGPIKILRVLRVLRPLRMISRNPGMKIAILSLINAIPDIGNVMVVSILFILLFAILGTNFYKGQFYQCLTENVPEEYHNMIKDRFQCHDYGGEWVNQDQNFDNIGQSLITLFNVMTTEGWIGVMWNAVDATQINQIQQANYSPINIMFFMLYMVACSLFVLNMFVGIVINVFNREKESLYMNHKLTQFQREWCDVLVFCYSQKPMATYQLSGNRFKDGCYKVATHYMLDNFIFLCIIINTVCLSLTWYNEPLYLKGYLENINMVFNIIYTIETTIKLIAFGSDFFKDGWNSFDFVIVVAAWVGTVANNIEGLELGQSSTIIKSFRICRIFKIIKKYKSLRILFYTFIGAIQQLTNVGGLLFLILFVYSVLGVQVFSGVKMQNSINHHANFQNFHNAIITLFRMATGESWHELMYDCARQKSIIFECQKSQDYYSFKENNFQHNECGNEYVSYFFYISFMVIVSFIFLNLFIAIILESFNTSQNEEGLKIGQQTLNTFCKAWSEYDKKGKGFIEYQDLEQIIDILIYHESEQLLEARIKLMDGELKKSAFENTTFLFNLHKNQYLSGNVLLRQAEIAKARKQKEDEEYDKANNVVKVVAGDEQQIQDENAKKIKEMKETAEQKEAMTRLMNYYIMHLKIPVYSGLYFYYYDVLEALARDVFVNTLTQERQEIIDILTIRDIWSTEDINIENREIASKLKKQKCKYCYEMNQICPLLKNLQDEHVDRYVECEETDEEMEQEHDFLIGDLDPILGKLEKKGQMKDVTINKYQGMSDLRAQRNNKSIENQALSEYGNAIIDSSQIKASQIIRRYFHNWKVRKNLNKFRDTTNNIFSAKKAAKKLKGKFGGKGFFKKKGVIGASGPNSSASPSSQPPAANFENMSISIDSSNSLSELNTIEPRPSVNLRSPISGASHLVDNVASSLHQINEIAHLEDAGDTTIIQYSQQNIAENQNSDSQNEMNILQNTSIYRDSGPGNKQGEEGLPPDIRESRQQIIIFQPSQDSLVQMELSSSRNQSPERQD